LDLRAAIKNIVISTKAFFRARRPSLTLVVVVMSCVALLQSAISYTIAEGALRKLMPGIALAITPLLTALRIGLVFLSASLWMLNRKHALFRAVIAATAFFTLALLMQTYSLVSILANLVVGARFGIYFRPQNGTNSTRQEPVSLMTPTSCWFDVTHKIDTRSRSAYWSVAA
jgi:hypothetical protein